LIGLVLVIAVAALSARLVETDFGRLDVRRVRVPSGSAALTGKLYQPANLSADRRLSAVLALHGYQNDKETQGAFALELARRGIVVLALDLVGHGGSDRPLAFSDRRDPTRGGDAGYQYLKTLPYVRPDRLGVMGHSLGAMSALAVAARNPDHRAVNSQCGPAGTPALHNVLLTQAHYEEFRGFRDGQPRVESLVTSPRRLKAFGLSGRVDWNTTYGRFGDGSARRAALIETVHPGVTHHPAAVAETIAWMQSALEPAPLDGVTLPPDDQRYMWKERAMLLAMVATLLSVLPLASLLLATPLFGNVARPLPAGPIASRRAWWRLALVNTLVAAFTYPPLTRLGGLSDQIGALAPWLRLPVGNGVMLWFAVNALIEAVLLWWWLHTTGRRTGATLRTLGLGITGRELGVTTALAAVLFGWMYGLEAISERALGIEFRFWWPMMRQFSLERFGLFWIYLPASLAFFVLNGGALLFGQARQPEGAHEARTLLAWWLWNCVAALPGLALVWALQYVPYRLFGTAPGFEAIGLPQFGEFWPLMLFAYIPIFAMLTFLLTWCYRRTGRVYLGALVVAAIATWFTTAGSVLAR
jgi:pimeloyl-ACP methyl ester carboxylesterase